MHHDHNHQSVHTSQRNLYFAAAMTLGYAAVEAGTGWWSNSLALLSDAGHMLTDTSALLIAVFAAWLAQRAPSAQHSYGLGRAEFIAALANGLLMLAVVSFIVIHAIERMQAPLAVKGEAVTLVAFIGLLLNVLVLYLLGHGAQDLNRRAVCIERPAGLHCRVAVGASHCVYRLVAD